MMQASPITGAPTSITAFIGRTAQGPLDQAVTIASVAEFEQTFGSDPSYLLGSSVQDFFTNGGTSAVIVRTLDPGNASAALQALADTAFNLLVMPVDECDDAAQKIVRASAAAFCREHCALYIVDPPAEWKSVDDVTGVEDLGIADGDASYAAVYFPRVMKANQSSAASGLVAGVMARTAAQQGVWKAPAGLEAVLIGIDGFDLEHPITNAENDQLNALSVNCLRQFPVYGNVVWGARTMRGADMLGDDYKYIQVRRLANYIEESLRNSLQWVVFEPNNETLWTLIRQQVASFMQMLYEQGAFASSSPKDAYFVNCDSTTTTPIDIEQGVVNVIVGFAPELPAEFVVLSIQQVAGQSA